MSWAYNQQPILLQFGYQCNAKRYFEHTKFACPILPYLFTASNSYVQPDITQRASVYILLSTFLLRIILASSKMTELCVTNGIYERKSFPDHRNWCKNEMWNRYKICKWMLSKHALFVLSKFWLWSSGVGFCTNHLPPLHAHTTNYYM